MKICLNKNNEKDIFRNVYGENKESAEDLSGNLYMDINALILKEEEHKRIYEAQSKVVKLFKDMQNIIQAQPTLLEWLGLPEILWTEICKKRISNLTSYGRFDWMFDKEDNLCLLEFNSETPFGWKEAIDYHKNIHKYFNQYVDPNTNMTELLRKSVYKSLNEQGFSRCDRIAIIGDLMDEEELETFEVLKRELGYECEDVFIESIHKLVTMLGEIYLDKGENFYPIDFLQTFYSSEWMVYDRPREEFVKALKTDKVKLINPVSTLITHSKGLFALIWYLYSERGLLKEHSETIENHIPYTSFLEDEFSEDEKFVAKPLNHREGSGVEIRTKVSNIDNDELIYQNYIDSIELEYPVSDINFNRKNQMLKPTIGTYLLNDEFGGYYTRLSKEICSSEFAIFVPTFIE